MIITPTEHDAPNESPDAVELLIKEARRKARRRRLAVGTVLIAVLVVIAAILIVVGREPTGSARPTGSGSGGATGTNSTSVYAANLAGASTFAVAGSHVWVTIDYFDFKTYPDTHKRFELVELNANSGRLVRVIKNRSRDLFSVQDVAPSGSQLWVTTNSSVSEFDATNGSLVRVINAKADQFADPGAIAVSNGHVWVANGETGKDNVPVRDSITELNASNGSLVRVINAKADRLNGPAGLALSPGRVWVLNENGHSVTELNARNGSLVRVINVQAGPGGPNNFSGPRSLTVSGPHLWVGEIYNDPNGSTSTGSVAEFKVSNGALVRIIKAPADKLGIPSDIVVGGGSVWVQNGGNGSVKESITELNGSNGSLVRVINAKSDGFNSANGLAVSGSYVLVLNIYSGARGSVTELNANNGSLARIIR